MLNKRQDGYHNILSVMAQVDLFDLLKLKHIRVSGRNGGLAVDVQADGGDFAGILGSIPVDENLIAKASRAYFNAIGKSGEVSFSIRKDIPAGAGLGGGSSDAAAALVMLNEHFGDAFGEKLNDGDLVRLGAGIGADVPFCLAGGTAICEGIGEIMEPVENGLRHRALIAFGGVQVSTALAYRSLGRGMESVYSPEELARRRGLLRECLSHGDVARLKALARNDFETSVFAAHPGLPEIKRLMYGAGADFTIMTGSGSGMMGLFRNRGEERWAARALRDMGIAVFTASFV